VEENVLEVVKAESPRLLADLLLIALHPLFHPPVVDLLMMRMIFMVHLVPLEGSFEAEPLAITSIGEMLMIA
jgi:hypothetical protein